MSTDAKPVKEIGVCPDCKVELKRVGHQPDGGKGRYKCMNTACRNNGWMNRYGEKR